MEILQRIDWDKYELRLYEATLKALKAFSELQDECDGEEVFEISIWTDPQGPISAISFETQAHAVDHIAHRSAFLNKHKMTEWAAVVENRGYANNPQSFKYPRYRLVEHPELEIMDQVHWSDMSEHDDVLNVLTPILERVVDKMIESEAFKLLQKEDIVWIGVNSARDWFDHVRKVTSAHN